MILSYSEMSSLALGPSAKQDFNPATKATEGFWGPHHSPCILPILSVLALSLG